MGGVQSCQSSDLTSYFPLESNKKQQMLSHDYGRQENMPSFLINGVYVLKATNDTTSDDKRFVLTNPEANYGWHSKPASAGGTEIFTLGQDDTDNTYRTHYKNVLDLQESFLPPALASAVQSAPLLSIPANEKVPIVIKLRYWVASWSTSI